MEDIFENPIVVAVIEVFSGRLADADAIEAVQRFIDLVRADIHRNAALHNEAAAQLAVARQRYAAALLEAASELGTEDVAVVGSPELAARAAAYAELKDRIERALRLQAVLVQALGFLILLRAAAYAWSRAPLIPGVLATAAAAYALAYAASGGAVTPGPASLVRIAVLLLVFLFGFLG
ncbi:hypothetical protein SETIT_5G283900v2 [Setaria italica]|uniref:Uncharacterized protein n=1 Tax=Setaria italica TaxID=4555 RepID=A0A368RA08_SETIT|nr:hypothetical protein SETIT_5G283900v2 [Setaria italica]